MKFGVKRKKLWKTLARRAFGLNGGLNRLIVPGKTSERGRVFRTKAVAIYCQLWCILARARANAMPGRDLFGGGQGSEFGSTEDLRGAGRELCAPVSEP
jgi:hypothetical protein